MTLDFTHAATKWFGRQPHQLAESERRALERAIGKRTIAEDPGRHIGEHLTFGERLADRVARLGGSWRFIAAFCLFYVHPRKRYDGQVFLAFVALYASARFVLEIWRSDERGGVFGLSTSQLIGLALAGVAVLADRHLRRAAIERRRPAAAPPAAQAS